MWDRQAARYPAQEHRQARALAVAVRLAATRPGDQVIDLATGTGAMLRALAALPADRRPAGVVGVDRSAGMLARAAATALPDGWTTVAADARAVPRPAAAADVVTCAYLLHLLTADQSAAVLAEALRLLRPGGRLIVVTVWIDRSRPGGRLAGLAFGAAARAAPATLGGLRPHDPSALLTGAGFVLRRRVQVPRPGYPSLVIAAGRPGDGPPLRGSVSP
ncbi:tRNA methyltransferase [Paraconexibacter sp. AEG42_29]|uniref:tRNA methyltransferase n=1 Tax=Paraconexibacter sp. AEG42_29 TaxID=2997339 RepID=A0AAU7AZ69_9ACTN